MNELYMRRCLELAKLGAGNVAPNPMVGAVVVYNDKIIGEGYHKKFGGPHAEVNAINSVKDKSLLPLSEIYVSLEPCAHYGKTPPCADLIINSGIKKVYVGCRDSFEKVDGKGIEKLKNAGVDVTIGILEEECINLNKRFFCWCEKKRPYIILKWAQTLDGFIDISRDNYLQIGSVRISNFLTEILSHKWRCDESAIMIGTNTAKNDNPSLTSRLWNGNNPTRIVIDKSLKLNKSLNIFDISAPTIIITSKENKIEESDFIKKIDFSKNVASQIVEILYQANLQSVIIEGGAKLHQTFINENLWDEARIFIGNKTFNSGLKSAIINGKISESINIQDNKLIIMTNSQY